jgi:hypothetical protein
MGPAMEDVGVFIGHLVYFVAFWYILWLVGIFSPVIILYQEKTGNPALHLTAHLRPSSIRFCEACRLGLVRLVQDRWYVVPRKIWQPCDKLRRLSIGTPNVKVFIQKISKVQNSRNLTDPGLPVARHSLSAIFTKTGEKNFRTTLGRFDEARIFCSSFYTCKHIFRNTFWSAEMNNFYISCFTVCVSIESFSLQ